jgi:hypothetical protein
MTQTLANLCDEIREALSTLPEIERLYSEVPNAINEWPALVVVPLAGASWLGSHGHDTAAPLHSQCGIRIEVHLPSKDLPTAYRSLAAIASTLPVWLYSAFVRDRFDGAMVTTGDPRTANNATAPVRWEITPAAWNSTETIALLLDFDVTTEQEVYR